MQRVVYILLCYLLLLQGMDAQQNYLDYHLIINEAENQWSQEDFSEALLLYDSAFTTFDYVFTKDYVIAAQIAALDQNLEKTLAYMEQAGRNGYRCECFTRFRPIQQFIPAAILDSLQDKTAAYQEAYLQTIDTGLRAEFSQRYRDEQDAKSTPRYRGILQSNYQRILRLLDSLPFPSERIVGLDNVRIAPNRINRTSGLNDCAAGNSKVIVTLLHAYNPVNDIGFDRLLQAVQSGHLHPRQLAAMYAYTENKKNRIDNFNDDLDTSAINPPLKLNHSLFGKKYTDLEQVDRDRARIGLCPLAVEERKKAVGRKYRLGWELGYQ